MYRNGGKAAAYRWVVRTVTSAGAIASSSAIALTEVDQRDATKPPWLGATSLDGTPQEQLLVYDWIDSTAGPTHRVYRLSEGKLVLMPSPDGGDYWLGPVVCNANGTITKFDGVESGVDTTYRWSGSSWQRIGRPVDVSSSPYAGEISNGGGRFHCPGLPTTW